MRITSTVVAFIAGLTLAMTGCGGVTEPEQSPSTAPAVEQGASEDVTAMAACPLRWFCDSNFSIYTTKSACQSACAVDCYRDYDCSGRCICP